MKNRKNKLRNYDIFIPFAQIIDKTLWKNHKILIFSQSFIKTAQKQAIYCGLIIFLYLCDKFVVEFQIWTNKF